MFKLRTMMFAVIALFAQLPSASIVLAGAPTEQVRQTADKVLALLQDGRLKATENQKARREQLRQIIATRFDFTEMAKRSLGAYWQRVTSDDQRQFIQLFTAMLEKSYVDQIENYNGEKILYGRESLSSDQAEVETKILTKKGEEFSLNYKLRGAGGDWQVYDVIIENVSLVNNFRSQFSRILANSSFAELMKKLQSKGADVNPVRG
jgi:phospholipid transport system substrate-binding protein